MSSDRWQRVRAVLAFAVELPAAAVEEFLERECGGDEALRDEVRRLLRERAVNIEPDHSPVPPAGADSTVSTVSQGIHLLGGRYLLQRELGRGGFGAVYLAADEQLLSKRVVVKVMLSATRDSWRRKKFRDEIEALVRLNHPNIVSVSDCGETVDGRPFLVMEYIEGRSLRHQLRPEGMDLKAVAAIVRQAGAALEAAHRSGIWHRDLKPDNIMIQTLEDGEPRVKLIDFGIATVNDSTDWTRTASRVAGTLRYMAPEQLAGRPGAASDLYSLGVIAYEMVTGRPPFRADNPVQLHSMQMEGLRADPRGLRADLPAAAGQAILTALAFDEAGRQKTVAGFAQELLQGLEAPSSPSRADRNTAPQARRKRLWPRVLLAVIAAATPFLATAALAMRAPHLQTSMVVFQVRDLVNDPAFLPLSHGLTGALVSRLVHVKGLTVKQYYGTREASTGAISNVRFYLDGDLQKYQNRIRLTLRLTDTGKGDSVAWASSFDHDLDNPLELESEIAREVVEGLEDDVFSPVTRPQRAQLAGRRFLQWAAGLLGESEAQISTTQNAAAYRSYMRGSQLFAERTPAAVEAATASLQQAVRQDPNFGLAWATLSDTYRAAIEDGLGPQVELTARSLKSAQTAVSVSPRLPEAHAALAAVRQQQWDWQGSEQSYREAIRLDPQSPVAYRRYGGLLLQFGRFDEALQYARKGLELDPYDYPGHSAFGFCLMMARRYREAEDRLKWTLAQRDLISAHDILGWVYAYWGRQASGDEAKRYFDLALAEAKAVHNREVQGAAVADKVPTPLSDNLFAICYSLRGERAAARRFLNRMLAEANQVSPSDVAEIYASLGDTSTALSYLAQAARIKDRGLLYLKVSPAWDSIRNAEGFREILREMRL